MNLQTLIKSIQSVDAGLKAEAGKTINRLLTIRNWLIGYYIVEYEQQGKDKAKYGDNLLKVLAENLVIKGLSETALKVNRQFYLNYPQIRQTLSDFFQTHPFQKIHQTLPGLLTNSIVKTPSAQSLPSGLQIPPEKLINGLSFSHITVLLTIDDPLKRTFYEAETIKGSWNVRELKRQVNSLYFERMGMSRDKQKLAIIFKEKIKQPAKPSDYIKNIYAFEFLELPIQSVVEESELEQALLDHLQDFLLEFGHGFCLEGRQKRILIGDEYFFIDLVFYHRLLKCHVLVDLKVDEFKYANAGQINTFINYYRQEVMQPDDNPPVGILLVTDKNNALVQYATANMDENLFVKKYMLQLPDKKTLENLIKNEIREMQ